VFGRIHVTSGIIVVFFMLLKTLSVRDKKLSLKVLAISYRLFVTVL